MIKTGLFGAGLGDVIRVIYTQSVYQVLSESETPVRVVIGCHNPYAVEIFRHHRNSSNFVIYDAGHKFEEFMEAGLRGQEFTNAICEFFDFPQESIVRGKACPSYVPMFDAPDEVLSEGHFVLCPFAGGVARDFPSVLLDRIVDALRKIPVKVFIVTRSFPRKSPSGSVIHSEEDARKYAGGNIQVLENLTVPATINLIRNCCGYIGAWSSMLQTAWFEKKPVATIYPVDWVDVVNRTGYAFGIERDECFYSDFDEFDSVRFARWLEICSGALVVDWKGFARNAIRLPDPPPEDQKAHVMRKNAERISQMGVGESLNKEFDELIERIREFNWKESVIHLYPVWNRNLVERERWGNLMRRIGEVGGMKAMKHFTPADMTLSKGGYDCRKVMEGWANVDLGGARSYLEALSEGNFKNSMAIGFFRALVDETIDAVRSMYRKDYAPLFPQIAWFEYFVMDSMGRGGAGDLEKWTVEVEKEEGADSLRAMATKQVYDLVCLERFREFDYSIDELVAEFFNRKDVPPIVLISSVRELGKRDPIGALRYIQCYCSALPGLVHTIPYIVEAWMGKDLSAVEKWLDLNEGEALYEHVSAACGDALFRRAEKWRRASRKV